MKRFIFLFFIIFVTSWAYSQCSNNKAYDGTPIPGGVDINDGEEHQIAPGIAAGEYVVINGLNASDHYRFTSNRTNIPNADYITIYDASNNNLLANKTTPLELDPINATSIEIHINLDAGCVTDDEFHDLTIQNLTNATCNMPGAPGGITYKSDDQIDFYWGAPALSTPTGYDWRVVLAGNDPDTFVASGSTVAPTTNASTGAVLSAGTSYHIYVRSTCSGGQESGWFKFPPTYITNTVEPPSNDFCEGAISIVQELNIAGVGDATAIPGNLAGGAGTNVDAETCGGRKGNARDDVWYTFIAQTNDVHVNLDPTFDGVLTLYSGNCNSLSYLACADTPSETLSDEEIYTGSLNLGQRYYLRVYFYGTTTPLNPTFNLKIWSDTAVTDNDNDGYADHPNLDCDDTNPNINPETVWYLDADGDNYAIATIAQCSNPGVGYTTNVLPITDCDDTDPNVNPNSVWYADSDGDGYGDNAVTLMQCEQPANYVLDNTDCDDGNVNLNPGTVWYLDADNDNYAISTKTQCSSPGVDYTTTMLPVTDCDDTEPTIYPGAQELCDGLDNDCANGIDDGLAFENYYTDSDGDGYGDSTDSPENSCETVLGKVTNNSDCDDTDADINPDTVWYLDADNDNYAVTTTVQCSSPGVGYTTTMLPVTDCNDGDSTVYPGATEICDGKDNDCDGQTDEGLTFVDYYADTDGDSYGDPDVMVSTCDGAPSDYVTDNTDCDDTKNTIHPGATEIPDNGIDEDCDGSDL
ncbi:putative metal-binding motif-containing protein, partial [Flavisericum labens]|uniref:putative metal-binding motif-containing protein n=1 Tax=Flavisericum labens TaxID=3377112 RepID=UPI00387ABAC6